MKSSLKKKAENKTYNHEGAENPVSLWGASFTEVLAALLKTKPVPKENEQKKQTKTK